MILKILYKLAKIYWWLFRPKTFGVRIIIKNGNKIALVLHIYANKNLWSLPGGSIKKYEKPEEAIIREVKEELGIEIEPRYLDKIVRNAEYKRDTVYCFIAEVDENDLSPDNKEISEAKWFELNNLPSNLSPFAKSLLRLAKLLS